MPSLNRRSFMYTSAVSAAAAGFTSLAQGDTQPAPPSENIHYALVGAGAQGRWDSSFLLKVPGVKLVAICDINPYSLAEAKKLAPDAPDLRKLGRTLCPREGPAGSPDRAARRHPRPGGHCRDGEWARRLLRKAYGFLRRAVSRNDRRPRQAQPHTADRAATP